MCSASRSSMRSCSVRTDPMTAPKLQMKIVISPETAHHRRAAGSAVKPICISPTHPKKEAGRAYSQREPFPENPGDAACSDFRRGLRRKKTGSGSAGKGLSHKRQELQRYVLDTTICLIFLNIKRLLIPDAFFARTKRFSKFFIHRQFFYSQH